jgi:hypothetical protein
MFASEARLTDLVDLRQQRQASHQALLPHLAQRLKVDMAEASMPPPCIFTSVSRQADRACNVEIERVQSAWTPADPGEQAIPLITNSHHPLMDQDLVSHFIKLAATDDVGCEARDEVGVGQWPVFTSLALEQDGVAPFDLCHSAVAKAHGARDVCVEVGEECPRPRHMVRRASVEDPASRALLLCVV